jgi:hypothetical protein
MLYLFIFKKYDVNEASTIAFGLLEEIGYQQGALDG